MKMIFQWGILIPLVWWLYSLVKQPSNFALSLDKTSQSKISFSKFSMMCLADGGEISYNGSSTICKSQSTDNFIISFNETDPNPPKTILNHFVINEINPDNPGADTVEFIEIMGPPDSSLAGFVLVLFNGGSATDAAYLVLDLDKFKTDECGYFLVRSPAVNDPYPDHNLSDTSLSPGWLQNGQDAVALYHKPNFANGSSPVISDLIDAIIYGATTDAGLQTALGLSAQYTESTTLNTSIKRIPEGTGPFMGSIQIPSGAGLQYSPGISESPQLYTYLWLLSRNDSILQVKPGGMQPNYPANFSLADTGEYCIYGISLLGNLDTFLVKDLNTIQDIQISISNGFCAQLSSNCSQINVVPELKFLSSSITECSEYTSTGTFRFILKWIGTAEGPFLKSDYSTLVSGAYSNSNDTTCFISNPILGGDTIKYALIDPICLDTISGEAFKFCDFCSLMTEPNEINDLEICGSEPFVISPSGGGIRMIKLAADLFFSEYIEGSNFNKCLEIYNGTGLSIDLAAENYQIKEYFNASTTPLYTIPLTGVIASGQTYVICHSSAEIAFLIKSQQISNLMIFNGDDAIELIHDGISIDIIGQIGFDPGGQWGSGLLSTENNTLIRNELIFAGDTSVIDNFIPSNEWNGYGENEMNDLGFHNYSAPAYLLSTYKFYDANPLLGGSLLHIGHNYPGSINPGTDDSIFISACNTDYNCESSVILVKLKSSSGLLTCLDQVNISLPRDQCKIVITSDDIIKNPGYCQFKIKLTYPFGSNTYIEENVLDKSHIGQTIFYSALDFKGNSCWGYILLEDKAGPFHHCGIDTISCFELNALPGLDSTLADNCSKASVTVLNQTWSDSSCEARFRGAILRNLVVKDIWGNAFTCQDTLLIQKDKLMDLNAPDLIEIECDLVRGYTADLLIPDSLIQYQSYGLISISKKVVPTLNDFYIWPFPGGLCKLIPIYDDLLIPLCGNSFMIRRQWKIFDWCNQDQIVFIQYIKILDKKFPRAPAILPVFIGYTSPHECLATLSRLRPPRFNDCSPTNVYAEYEYTDPLRPGSHVYIRDSMLSTLRLPVGKHNIRFTATDDCLQTTILDIEATVHDLIPPSPVCDGEITSTLDPATCWARIYASECGSSSRDNCQEKLHFAIATQDSIEYWSAYWINELENKCGKKEFWDKHKQYLSLIDQWINTYIFADYIDLGQCGERNLILRVYEADRIPLHDPHTFSASAHQWYCINAYALARVERAYLQFKASFSNLIHTRPGLNCIDSLFKLYYNHPVFDQDDFLYHGQLDQTVCTLSSLQSDSSFNYGCEGVLYNDCLLKISIEDKSSPVCEEPKDKYLYCDHLVSYSNDSLEFAASVCNLWTAGQETNASCYSGHAWVPIYCNTWLALDRTDTPGKMDPSLSFDIPVLKIGQPDDTQLGSGRFFIWDNCSLPILTSTDQKNIDPCGQGWIKRTWTATDICGKQSTICDQKIFTKHRSDFEIIFPADIETDCLQKINDLNPEILSKPIVSDDECELIGINYEDQIYNLSSETSYKIVRTWKIIDWCKYEPDQKERAPEVIVDDRWTADNKSRFCVFRNLKDDGDGYMIYIQIIKVIDREAPVITVRDTLVCYTIGENADKAVCALPDFISADFQASDNCSSTQDIRFRWELALHADQISIIKSQNNQTNFQYTNMPMGQHKVWVYAKDQYGNEDTTSFQILVKDCKKPVPYCYQGLATLIMPANGKIKIWASDFDAGSYDNCSLKNKLGFSFSSSTSDSTKEFTCADILDGKIQKQDLKIWVTDEAGNQDYCSTYILLQDGSGNICPDSNLIQAESPKNIQTNWALQANAINHFNLFQNKPNPYSNHTYIEYYIPEAGEITFTITDVSGRIWHQHQLMGEKGQGNLKLDRNVLTQSGIYFYTLEWSGQKRIRKLVKME